MRGWPRLRLSNNVRVTALLVMDRDEELRKEAADAQAMADRAISPRDRESWLRIAQGWLALIPGPKRTPQERFDAQVREEGTRQTDSKESH